MSSMNSNQITDQFTLGEVPICGTLNEQCLMVEQKIDDATTMLNQPTAFTALDPTSISDLFDFVQGNDSEQLLLDSNDDIYVSHMNVEDLFVRTECYGEISSHHSNLENAAANSRLGNGMFASASVCTASYPVDRNANICETIQLSGSDVKQDFTPSSEITVSNSSPERPEKSRRRRKRILHKEKLYMKTEPFSDEEMEKKRLNALKAKKNRTKQKDMFLALKDENAKLHNELLESKSKIKELQDIVLALQENDKQKNLSLHLVRDQLSTIIGE